jgi:hypothetical protein
LKIDACSVRPEGEREGFKNRPSVRPEEEREGLKIDLVLVLRRREKG